MPFASGWWTACKESQMANATLLRDEIDILYSMSNKLTQASTPAEWLEAVSDYARDIGAVSGVLFYLHTDASGEAETLEIAAQWSKRQAAPVVERHAVPIDRTRASCATG